MYKVFLTINMLDQTKCYVGMTGRTDKKASSYKGSGKYFLSAINKYGEENFTRVDLGEFNNKDECHYWEGFYIKLYKTEVKYGGYNVSPTGGMQVSGKHSEMTKKQIGISNSKALKGKHLPKIVCEKIGNALRGKQRLDMKGKNPWNKGLTKETDQRVKQYGENVSKTKKITNCEPWNKGQKLSDEHINKLRISHTGLKQSEETKNKRSISMIGKNVGKIHTKEQNEKHSLRMKENYLKKKQIFQKSNEYI